MRNRLAQGIMVLLAIASGIATAQESHQFKDGKEKLAAFREVLKSNKFRPTTQTNPAYCQAFMKNLLETKGVQPIEPVAQAMSENDPGLKKWHQCDGVDYSEMKTNDPKTGFDGMSMLGGPPYRYYRMDIDGDPKNGKEDMLYHEIHRDETGQPLFGRSAYTWVDLEGCAVRGIYPVEFITLQKDSPPSFLRTHMLVSYKRMPFLLELFPITDSPNVSNYHFRVTAVSTKVAMLCAWHESSDDQ